MSLLGNIVRSNKKEPGGAGGVASANNGLSLDTATGTIVQIGNDTGLATAILLNDREIPMGGFSYLMHSGGNDQLLIDPAGSYKIGDIDNALGKTTFFDIDAVTGTITSNIIDGTGRTGIFFTSFNGSFLSQDDGEFAYVARTQSNNASLVSVQSLNGRASVSASHDGANPYLHLTTESESADDILNLDIFRDRVRVVGGVAGVTATLLTLDTATGLYQIGDIAAFNNGTFLQIDDTAQIITVPGVGDNILEIDKANGLTTFRNGDLSLATGYTKLFTGTNGAGTDGFIDGEMQDNTSAKFIRFSFSSTTQNFEFVGLNGIKISGDTTLLHTGTALANGAGASGGTLTNAPAAGNPTKWVKIDDNGTVRHIPAW